MISAFGVEHTIEKAMPLAVARAGSVSPKMLRAIKTGNNRRTLQRVKAAQQAKK